MATQSPIIQMRPYVINTWMLREVEDRDEEYFTKCNDTQIVRLANEVVAKRIIVPKHGDHAFWLNKQGFRFADADHYHNGGFTRIVLYWNSQNNTWVMGDEKKPGKHIVPPVFKVGFDKGEFAPDHWNFSGFRPMFTIADSLLEDGEGIVVDCIKGKEYEFDIERASGLFKYKNGKVINA